MTRSRTMTAMTMSSQSGSATRLRMPQPRSAAIAASATGKSGKISRTATVLKTTTPMLAYQRSQRGWESARRGAASSHSATAAKMPRKQPTLIAGSFALMNSGMSRSGGLRDAPMLAREPRDRRRRACPPSPRLSGWTADESGVSGRRREQAPTGRPPLVLREATRTTP